MSSNASRGSAARRRFRCCPWLVVVLLAAVVAAESAFVAPTRGHHPLAESSIPSSLRLAASNEEPAALAEDYPASSPLPLWDRFSALTLAATDMEKSMTFYEDALGLTVAYRSEDFGTLQFPPDAKPHEASVVVNLQLRPEYTAGSSWGRAIFYVTDVDAFYEQLTQKGVVAEFPPRDAPWGERYFHVKDPSGHELAFAKPLQAVASDE